MVFFRFSPVNGGYSGKRQEGVTQTFQIMISLFNIHICKSKVEMFFMFLTDRSCEHVVHQSAQTPPVHGSVVSASHQDLWGPATM